MKRSSKKSRNLKKKSQKKCLLATGMMVCLGTFPVWSNDDVLLTLIPNAGKAFGSAAGIDYDYGLGAKLTYRKGDSLDFFLQGDYKRLAIDKLSPVDLMSISAGAGYHFKLNDRLGLNLSAQAGAYMASKSDGMVTGPTAGLSVSFTYRLNPVVSIEAGANVSHYAASPQPLLTDAGGSAALTVNLTEAFTDTTKVKMETNELLPVFPVLYSWYKNNAFATVGITNQEDAAIEDVTVSFYQSQFMNQPNVCAKVDKLGSGETVNAELTAFFNERMLDLTEKTDTEATVIIEYSYLGKKKKKEIGMIVPVYGRNSMSWDDDRRAAVFVSSKDPAALWFAKYISSIVRDNARPATRISQNIQYAMGIFETLDQFGLNYVIDPSSAYSDNVGGSSIDFLQFPFQTLTYRGGDCDDISILVCSLFEAVGIKTGFITIPGHIFMAFDSGLTMKEAGQSMMNTSNLFDLKGDGEAWIPLEITLTDEGFSRAWKVGAREWTTTAPEDRMFYAMEDCWKLYEPVSVPGATANFTLPEQKIVTRLFQHSMDNWIAKEISPVISQYNMLLARNESDQLRNELGILYGEYGLFVEADDQFKRARRNGYLPSLLNTANVYFARKQFAIALEWYKQVLEKDPENDLAMLGVARCNYELENFDECDKAYNYLRNKNPELANEYRYLGAFEETRGRSYSLADRLSLTIWDRGEFDSGIINDGTFEQQAELASREDENGFVTSDGANSSDFVDSDTANLFAQLTDMTDPSSVLRPDAIIADTQSYEKVPEDPYAKLDDPSVLVQELPGLIAQLRLPEPDFGNTDPIMISDYQLIAKTQPADTKTYTDAGATVVVGEKPVERTVSTQITQQQPATSTPVIAETSTKAEKKELIAFEKTDPEPTQIAQTPVTTTPTVVETRPSGQTSVTTQTPVTNEPTYVAQTPVTTTPSVTTTQPGYTTQTPVTTEPTQIAQTPATTTPTVTTTQPGYTTQTTVTTQTPVTSEPTQIAQTPVTTTPSVTETRPSGQTTATTQPGYTTQTTVTTQTPVTSEPTYIAQTPVTTTPSVAETRPSGQTTTVTTQQPGYTTQTPVTTTPSVTETRPSGQTTVTTTHPGYTTQTTVTTQTPVTNEPTYIAQTPVTTTPSVTTTQPGYTTQTTVTTQTPGTNEPTYVAQTPVTTTPSVTETRPSGQTSVTTTQPGYTTQTTVATQTPVTNEPTYIAQTPVTTTPSVTETRPSGQTSVTTQTPVTSEPTQITQTPVTTTPSVTETRPSGQTSVTTQTPVTSEPTQIAQTPVTTTPSVVETRPSGQTSVTTTQPGYITQTPVTNEPTYIAQTPVTTTPSVTETRPSGQTSVTTTQTLVTNEPTYIAQTPVTTTPSVTETRPSGQTTATTQPGYTTQTTVTTQTPVTNEPTYIAQTPVTTTPSVVETRPSGQTTVTTQQPAYTTQTTVTTQTPVTNEPTYIAQTPITTTPTVTETRPSGQTSVTTTHPGYTTQTTVATQTPVTTEPTYIAQTPVTTTPTVTETRPSGQTTVTTTQPGYTTQTTVTTQTPVTSEPTQITQTPVTTTPSVTTTQPGYTTQTPVTTEPTYIVQTPATTTPTVTETRPSGQTSVTTTQPGYTTQTPVTSEPTQITQTPVTTTPSVTTTQPGYTTQTTVTTQTPVTNEPTQIAQTPVTTTPSVTETRPSGQTTATTQPGYTTQTTVTTQTPVTTEPTYIAQTPVTTTPSVTETRPSGQTTATTTQLGYTTQTTVATQTPGTNEPTQIAQTPVTTTPSVTETRPSGQTTVTTQQPAYTTQTTVTTQTPVTTEPTQIAQTPVTTTPSVTETRPSGQTSVTTTQPGYTTQTTVATQTPVTSEPTYIVQTPVTTTPSVSETRPSGQTTVTTDDVMITDPEVDEWEYEFFEALMNPPNFDDLADAPIGFSEKDDKIGKAESTLPSFNTNIDSAVAIGPELPEEKIVEREAPRFSEQPSSRWVPEQVYSAKTIPGMKTYEEEMALYSNDKSWLYEDEPELLSDDSEETIQREKMQEEAAIKEAEEKKNKGNFAFTETDDEVLASLFQYLDENVLEEIQHTDLAERINEQARKKITGKKKTPVASTEPVVQDKKSGLLSKAEEINEKIEEEQIEEIAAVQVEQMEPVAVNIDPEPKIDIGEDAGIKEKSKFNAGPYVAGGAGLVGLLIIFLLIFVKRDDDDDDDKKKNPPKPEVRV